MKVSDLPDIPLDQPSTCKPFPPSGYVLTSKEWEQMPYLYETFDICTFTYNNFFPPNRVKRLICGKPTGITTRLPKHTKIFTNIHAKIYLCYVRSNLRAAYIGSANAVHPTLQELMFKIPSNQLPYILDYYNRLWKHLK